MFKQSWLLFFEGTYQTQENIPGTLSRIYQVTVPKGQVWEIDPSRPFLLYLLAKDIGLTPSAVTDGTVTTSRTILTPTIASGQEAPVGRYEVLVGTVGGNKTRLTVTGRTANTLTFSGTVDDGTTIDAYYIPDVKGRLQIRIEDPRYMVTLDTVLFMEDPSVFARPNPFKTQSMYHLGSPLVIPEDFILSLWLDADWTVAWEDSAGNRLPAMMQLPILVHSIFNMPAGMEERIAQLMAAGT